MQGTTRTAAWWATGVLAVAAAGCDPSDNKAPSNDEPAPPVKDVYGPTTRPDRSAGGAPYFGTPTGTGFPTGDASHSGGQGSGHEGYHDTGAAGTSGSITDGHPVEHPVADPQMPILPPQR